jgi:hypothetical protein
VEFAERDALEESNPFSVGELENGTVRILRITDLNSGVCAADLDTITAAACRTLLPHARNSVRQFRHHAPLLVP